MKKKKKELFNAFAKFIFPGMEEELPLQPKEYALIQQNLQVTILKSIIMKLTKEAIKKVLTFLSKLLNCLLNHMK